MRLHRPSRWRRLRPGGFLGRRIENLLKLNWQKFMLESNRIEGEDRLNPGDAKAFNWATTGIESGGHILRCHHFLTQHLNVDWSGKWRTCNVGVGNYTAPRHQLVPGLMEKFVKELSGLSSWEAHNRFQKIHPFQDFNGRVGRLIWLSKAIHEGYNFRLSFLHKYYYQTLGNQPQNAWLGHRREPKEK